jgi:hypothetical protein
MVKDETVGRRFLASRRLQKVGYSTLTMSLPREWVDKNKLESGNLVKIFEEPDGALHVEIEETSSHTLHCQECGSEISLDSRFCKQCGHEVGPGEGKSLEPTE